MELKFKEILVDLSIISSKLKLLSRTNGVSLPKTIESFNEAIRNESMWFLKSGYPKIGLVIFDERIKDGPKNFNA